MTRPLWIARSLVEQQAHRILVCGKKLKKWGYPKRFCQSFQCILVAGQRMAIDEGVESGVLPFNDDVETGSHRSEHSRGHARQTRKFPSGNPKHQWSARQCKVTQVSGEAWLAYNESVILPNPNRKALLELLKSGLANRGNLVDWTKLPDLAAVAALTCAFASVARRGQTSASRHWLTGWVLIALHFAALIFLNAPGAWGVLAGDIALISLTSAGVLFMWASVPYRMERSSLWMLISLLTANALYVFLLGFDKPRPWALNVAATLMGAVPLTIALTARRHFTHLLRWMLVGLYCVLAVFLLAVQNRQDNGPTLALNAVLFTVYFGCCLHVWYNYRGRGSAGSLITIAGFLGWATVFVVAPLLSVLAPNVQIESEVWNLPKYVVAVGMILLLLEDQIEHNKYLALHDELTGLPNRRLFLDRLALSLERARRMESKAALLVIDLNHFKEVNDRLGHHAGDLLLKKVSAVFQGRVRRSDTVARTGGDEFSLILEEPTNRSNARRVANSLMEILDQPLQVGDHTLKVGASIGVAVFPDDAADIEALCIAADLRMYDDKNVSREFASERLPVKSEPLPECLGNQSEDFDMTAQLPKI